MFMFREDYITKRYLKKNEETLKAPEHMQMSKLAEVLTYIAEGWEDSPWAQEIVRRAKMDEQYRRAFEARARQDIIKKALSGCGIKLI